MKTPYWIWQYAGWPHFCWNNDILIASLARVREKQGRLLGLMDGLGFDVQSASSLDVMTEELDPEKFFRISRSCIISTHAISSIIKQPGSRMRVISKPEASFEMTVSRARVDDFLEWLER